MKEIKAKKSWTNHFEQVEGVYNDFETLFEFYEGGDVSEEEILAEAAKTEKVIEELEVKKMLSGEEDQLSAMLEINPGAGGTESNDWAGMLMRMYIMWGESHGYKVREVNYQAGDVAGVKINGGMTVAPCPPPDIHIEDWHTSIELLKTLNLSALYLTHFGKVTNVNPHLDELKVLLTNWANWIKPFYVAQTPIDEIIPKFVAYVHQQLVDYGVDEFGLQQYEAANPANMSVAGLLRYWKKYGNIQLP